MNNVGYMDGVPVKIAEKFKPPPPIYNLPQPLLNKINLDDNFYWDSQTFCYDLQLEKRALLKIHEWKRIRQRNKEQRKDRILRKEQRRIQEYEDKQKNLLFNVSYPSADDLSSEDEEGNPDKDIELKGNSLAVSELNSTSPRTCLNEPANSFHNILQPTVLSFNSNSTAYNSLAPKINSAFEKEMSNSFNYKDFEEDTSSPFDNIELKTINDLDVLAQVLHNTQIKSSTNESLEENNLRVFNDKCNSTEICFPEENQLTVENIPKTSKYLPRFNNDFNSALGTAVQLRDHHLISMPAMHYKPDLPNTSLNNYHILDDSNNSKGYDIELNTQTDRIKSLNTQIDKDEQRSLIDEQMKSKSVPDILKELRDEIKESEIRRYRNCSFNMKDSFQPSEVCLTKKSEVEDNSIENADVLSMLDSNAQLLVEQISAMGFPLKRVARIVLLLGADGKKVVEHLIPLSELADLGFEERMISDALIRNENNKNKALDELIS